jgi:Domain of unknown function (DUF4263)
MQYRKFPRLNRWLEFESLHDFESYKESSSWRETHWAESVNERVNDFERLIDRRVSEGPVHEFLEYHPYLLPGFGDLHHGPYEGIVATKLSLGRSFVTDFAYIASNSQTLYFTCIEIESPKKRLFRADGRFHRDYLDARQQITDWLFWAKQNSREAIDCWGSLFNGRPPNFYDVAFRGYLIFGRRSQIDTRLKQERWSAEAASLHPNLQTMTYDRLIQRKGYIFYGVDNGKLAVCSYKNRHFVVKRLVI